MSPKVVFDTNIFISGIVYGGVPRRCMDLAYERKVELFTSQILLLELIVVLRKKFDWPEERIESVIEGISKYTNIINPTKEINTISLDQSDNRVLELAKDVHADFIVT